jgi:hypothetical protein
MMTEDFLMIRHSIRITFMTTRDKGFWRTLAQHTFLAYFNFVITRYLRGRPFHFLTYILSPNGLMGLRNFFCFRTAPEEGLQGMASV